MPEERRDLERGATRSIPGTASKRDAERDSVPPRFKRFASPGLYGLRASMADVSARWQRMC